MENPQYLKFEFNIWDILAGAMALFYLIYTFSFHNTNFIFYFVIFSLLLSVLMEIGVQKILIGTTIIYFISSEIFIVDISDSNIIDLFLLSNWSDNILTVFIALVFLGIISSLSIISSILSVRPQKKRGNFNLEYAMTLSTISEFIFSFILSVILAHDLYSTGIAAGFYLTVWQFLFIFFLLYNVIFTICLFSSFSINLSINKIRLKRHKVKTKEIFREKTKKDKVIKKKKLKRDSRW